MFLVSDRLCLAVFGLSIQKSRTPCCFVCFSLVISEGNSPRGGILQVDLIGGILEREEFSKDGNPSRGQVNSPGGAIPPRQKSPRVVKFQEGFFRNWGNSFG